MYDLTVDFIPASKPLSLEVYTTYVVIPFIVATLVADDIDEGHFSAGWDQIQKDGEGHQPLVNNDSALRAVIKSNAQRRDAQLSVDKENIDPNVSDLFSLTPSFYW